MAKTALRVLILDDDRASLRVLESMLTASGHQPNAVTDSRRVMAEIARFRPQVVVLDITMPHLDGYQVAEQMREDPSLDGVLIIALSTITGDGHALRAELAGIDRLLTKPIARRELEEAIGKFGDQP